MKRLRNNILCPSHMLLIRSALSDAILEKKWIQCLFKVTYKECIYLYFVGLAVTPFRAFFGRERNNNKVRFEESDEDGTPLESENDETPEENQCEEFEDSDGDVDQFVDDDIHQPQSEEQGLRQDVSPTGHASVSFSCAILLFVYHDLFALIFMHQNLIH